MLVPACVARSRTFSASFILRKRSLTAGIFRKITAKASCNPKPAAIAFQGILLRASLAAQAIASRPAMPRSACSASGTDGGFDAFLDRQRRGARVAGVAHWPADDDVVRAGGEGLRDAGGALLVVP